MITAIEKAMQTQLVNIQRKTGMSLKELADLIKQSGLSKYGEVCDMLNEKLGLAYGDANTLVQSVFEAATQGKNESTVLDQIYSGAKSGFRPIHDKLINEISKFGEFEAVPQKGYISLRRKKQFAVIEPKTNARLEVGINVRNIKKSNRLSKQPRGSRCNYIVSLTDTKEADVELITWLKSAYEGAG